MPAYNSGKYISSVIKSIQSQTFDDFKLVIIDDGSKDNTLAEIKSCASADSRVKFISKENEGIGTTRNLGLSLIDTEYFVFIDSDDSIEKDFLYELFESAKKNNSDVVICDYSIHSRDSKREVTISENCDSESYIKAILSRKQSGVLWNKLIKTSFVNENSLKFVDGINMWEDFYFCINLFTHNPVMSHVPRSLYNYIPRDDGLVMTQVSQKCIDDKIKIVSLVSELPLIEKKYKKYINGSKLFAKADYAMDDKLYDQKKWNSVFPLSIYDIISSEISSRIKVMSVIAALKLGFLSRGLIKLRFALKNR